MGGLKHIVGFSGGIDSQATARWVLNRYDPADVILTNSDAGGNEHPLTVAFIREYSETVHPVTAIAAVIGDMWKTPGFAETRGYRSDAPLDFPTMIEIKGRPPSRCAQFCTEILKLIPQKRWIQQMFGPTGPYADQDFIRYTGVRRDESDRRANQPIEQWDKYFDCTLRAPIADWSKQMCFDYIKAHREPINPLYALGFNRVGCAPCINSGKQDILNWYLRFPEMIAKIRSWETRTGRTYFAPMVPGKYTNNIDEVVEWAQTSRGGKNKFLPIMLEPPPCESAYNLCE